MSAVFTEAVEDKILTVHPARRAGKILKRPKTVEEDEEVDCFSTEEQRKMVTAAQGRGPLAYALVLTFFRTGMRVGEVLALHRSDLLFTERAIRIRRNWSSGRLTTPKSGKARTVDMSQGLAVALKDWIAHQDLMAAAAGQPSPEILFPGHCGGTRRTPFYLAENWLRKDLWYPLLEAAQVRHLTPHAARHTFASRLIANGENLKYVQAQLGHHSIKVTVDVYGHLLPEGNKQAVDRLDTHPTESDPKSLSGITREG